MNDNQNIALLFKRCKMYSVLATVFYLLIVIFLFLSIFYRIHHNELYDYTYFINFIWIVFYIFFFINSFKQRFMFYQVLGKVKDINDTNGNMFTLFMLYLPYAYLSIKKMKKEVVLYQ